MGLEESNEVGLVIFVVRIYILYGDSSVIIMNIDVLIKVVSMYSVMDVS